MTAFGTNRAIYYNVIPVGLQDKDGTVFFSTSALAAERQRIAQAQALDRVSQQPTRTIATVRAIAEAVAAQYTPDVAVVTLTDVDVRALKNGMDFPARFSDISYIQTAKYYQYYRLDFTTRGGGGASVYFREESQCDELAAAADTAVRAWKTKYPTVSQTQYYGIRKGSPIG
jgi:hypothetical protein